MSGSASRGRHGASREPKLRSLHPRVLSLLVGLVIALPLIPASASTREDHLAQLLESERNTIEVFRRAGGSVVFVTNKTLRIRVTLARIGG